MTPIAVFSGYSEAELLPMTVPDLEALESKELKADHIARIIKWVRIVLKPFIAVMSGASSTLKSAVSIILSRAVGS